MSKRSLVYAALTADAQLVAAIPAERWLQQGAVDRAPIRPFAIIAMQEVGTTAVRSAQPRCMVWVHDDRGSFLRIDEILARVKVVLEGLEAEDSTDRIVDVRWDGDSPDLVDPGYDTNTRNAQFTITGRK